MAGRVRAAARCKAWTPHLLMAFMVCTGFSPAVCLDPSSDDEGWGSLAPWMQEGVELQSSVSYRAAGLALWLVISRATFGTVALTHVMSERVSIFRCPTNARATPTTSSFARGASFRVNGSVPPVNGRLLVGFCSLSDDPECVHALATRRPSLTQEGHKARRTFANQSGTISCFANAWALDGVEKDKPLMIKRMKGSFCSSKAF
ncbi:hypothetical protein TRVL_07107 [Trypanosoma vivax]|uniref:Trypanosoma vivax n=1 Tax=Trypanosoma vivax (strain Y486) TaxID=1055687 RepID=G0TV29_TRYVY|nr:hypothetical protein TRVL_07107 [Trypanosoma vivax]CCC47794.1 hypothetical protein, unlikely [Trypanosoma vivax Y486]